MKYLYILGILLVIAGCFGLADLVCRKLEKGDRLQLRQRYISLVGTVLLFCLLPVWLASLGFLGLYLLCKRVIFRDTGYSLWQHWDNWAIVPALGLLGLSVLNGDSRFLYAIEFSVSAVALYLVIGKTIYRVVLHNPGSVFYLSPVMSYVPVIFIGLLYFFVAAVILITTLPV